MKPVIYVDKLTLESLKKSFGIVTEKDFIFTIHADFVLEKEVNTMHVANCTREEAIRKCHGIAYPECLVQALEALGLIKFKEPEPVNNVVCKEDRQKFKLQMRRLGYSEGSRAFHAALEAYDSTFS